MGNGCNTRQWCYRTLNQIYSFLRPTLLAILFLFLRKLRKRCLKFELVALLVYFNKRCEILAPLQAFHERYIKEDRKDSCINSCVTVLYRIRSERDYSLDLHLIHA